MIKVKYTPLMLPEGYVIDENKFIKETKRLIDEGIKKCWTDLHKAQEQSYLDWKKQHETPKPEQRENTDMS